MSDETLSFRKAPDVTCYDNNITNGSVARCTAHSQAYGKILHRRPTAKLGGYTARHGSRPAAPSGV
ncbi:MAG: hypothetical protein LBQ54_06785 [Planctomycetaceae bacterium]|nr:hypothetical protein [Planctomycetaceae bacterium]